MGFTLEDAFTECGELYKMKLVAGKDGCSNAISWIQMIEDTTIIQQLWGKELAVTTGLGFQSDEALLHFIEKLDKYHSAGLIINTGKYIFDIPKHIIDYCNEHEFPLITVPWEIHLVDIIKDFSMRCLLSEKEDQQISKYFINAFLNPDSIEKARKSLVTSFDVDGDFQILLINIEDSDKLDEITLRRISAQLQLCFEKIHSKYSFFWFDSFFVLVVNNIGEEEFFTIIEKMYVRTKKKMKEYTLHIGIGSKLKDIRNVMTCYKRAKAAVEMANHFNEPILHFNYMGIYKILFTIEDKDMLDDIYHEQLETLIEYDKKHHTEFEKTLYYYLKYNASPQKIASKMYTHRNTINYRISKIKQLINSELDSPEERFQYLLAFYIKNMRTKEKL